MRNNIMPFFSSETTQKDIDECAKEAEEKGLRVVLLLHDVAPETVKKIPKGIHTVQFYSSIPKVILDFLALPELQHVKNVGIIGGATAEVIDALPARFRIKDITVHGGDDRCRSKEVNAALDRRDDTAPLALHLPSPLLGPIHNSGNNHRNNHRNNHVTRTAPYQSSQLQPNSYTPPIPTIMIPGSQVYSVPSPSGVTRMIFWRIPSAPHQFFSAQPSPLSTQAPHQFFSAQPSPLSTQAPHQFFSVQPSPLSAQAPHQFFSAQPSPLSAQAPHQFFSAQPSALSSTAPRPFFRVPARASSTSAPHQPCAFAAQPSALSAVASEITAKQEDKKRVFSFEQKTPAEIAAACHLLHLDPDNISDSTEGTDESTDMETDCPAFTAGRSAVG